METSHSIIIILLTIAGLSWLSYTINEKEERDVNMFAIVITLFSLGSFAVLISTNHTIKRQIKRILKKDS